MDLGAYTMGSAGPKWLRKKEGRRDLGLLEIEPTTEKPTD